MDRLYNRLSVMRIRDKIQLVVSMFRPEDQIRVSTLSEWLEIDERSSTEEAERAAEDLVVSARPSGVAVTETRDPTGSEVARIIGLSPSRVRELRLAGEFPNAYKGPKGFLYPPSDVDAYLRNLRARGQAKQCASSHAPKRTRGTAAHPAVSASGARTSDISPRSQAESAENRREEPSSRFIPQKERMNRRRDRRKNTQERPNDRSARR